MRAWMTGWVNNREAGDLWHYRAHYDVIVMCLCAGMCGGWVPHWYHYRLCYLKIIKCKHFPSHSPHKGRWHGALIFSLMRAWMTGWVNNREAGDLWHYRAHYDVIVMCLCAGMCGGWVPHWYHYRLCYLKIISPRLSYGILYRTLWKMESGTDATKPLPGAVFIHHQLVFKECNLMWSQRECTKS